MSDQINQEKQIPERKKSFLKSRKSKVILSIAVILFAFVTISGIAIAKHFHKFHDGPGDFLINRITEKLNLTPDQKAQVEKIKAQIKERREAKKTDRESMFEEFAAEFKKDNIDRNKLKELAQKREQNSEEMKEFILDKIIEFHNILTPEQRNKAMDEIKDMKGRFHDGMKKFKEEKETPNN